MSGMDERPNKRLGNDVRSEVKGTFKVHYNPIPLRLVWRFGVFDRFMLVMGLVFLSLGISGLITPTGELGIMGAIMFLPAAGVYLGIGCVKREWQR